MATLQAIRDSVYQMIGIPWPNSTYPLSLIDSLINESQREICTWACSAWQQSGRLPVIIDKWPLTFLERQLPLQTYDSINLTATVNIGDTQISVSDTSKFPSSWYCYIGTEVIQYTSTDQYTLYGIPASGIGSIRYPYVGGSDIFVVYALPSDYSEAVRLVFNNNLTIASKDMRDRWYLQNDARTSNYYNVGNNSSTDGNLIQLNTKQASYYSILQWQYLYINTIPSGNQLTFFYNCNTVDLVAPTDETTIPDPWALLPISMNVTASIFTIRQQYADADRMNSIAIAKVFAMYDFFRDRAWEMIHNQPVYAGNTDWLNI